MAPAPAGKPELSVDLVPHSCTEANRRAQEPGFVVEESSTCAAAQGLHNPAHHGRRDTMAPMSLPESKPEDAMARTLHIRHMPDDVAERLERLASPAGLSLSTFALQELSATARRADNAELP